MFRKLLVVALLALPVVGICQKSTKKKKGKTVVVTPKTPATPKAPAVDENFYKAMGAPLPTIRAVTQARKVITNKDLQSDGNTLLMLFNPTCEHCMDMTMVFEKNIFLFKKTKILLMATEAMMPYLDYFENTVKTKEFPSIQVAVDSAKVIDKLFNYVALPQINFYNAQHKLIKTFNGDVPLDSLKLYIN